MASLGDKLFYHVDQKVEVIMYFILKCEFAAEKHFKKKNYLNQHFPDANTVVGYNH